MAIDFPNSYYHDLDRFASLVWGNPQAILQQHQPGDIEYIDLSGFLEAFQFLFVGIKHDKVFVRDEYRIALRTLQTDYDFGAYVLGQPGIGKSLFLIYALVQFLGQKQVVVLHTRPDFYLCFRESINVCSMTDTRPMCELPTVWALCDSNQSVQVPPDLFLYKPGRIRVIQTTSPKASSWKDWSKQLGAECYIMDIWSDQEIVELATLLGLDVQRLTALARKWGNIPRTLLRFIHTKDQTIEDWYRDRAAEAVLKCALVVREGLQNNLHDDALTSFFSLRPRRTDMDTIARMLSYMHVQTPTLRCLLAESLQHRTNLERIDFLNGLTQHALTRQAAVSIYGSWFHSFIGAGWNINCQYVYYASGDWAREPPIISANNIFAPANLDAKMPQKAPFYWIAPYRDFPGIQSVLVAPDAVFAFYLIIGSDNESPTNLGLRILRERWPEYRHWRVVFIGAEEDQLRRIANRWGGRIFFNPSEGPISTAWSVVDPVQRGVTYTVYHDESEELSKEFDEELKKLQVK